MCFCFFGFSVRLRKVNRLRVCTDLYVSENSFNIFSDSGPSQRGADKGTEHCVIVYAHSHVQFTGRKKIGTCLSAPSAWPSATRGVSKCITSVARFETRRAKPSRWDESGGRNVRTAKKRLRTRKSRICCGGGDDVVRFNVRCQYIPKREFV